MTYMLLCLFCKHYRNKVTCDAYPDGIPKEIRHFEVDHRQGYKGDNGIQYEEEDKTPGGK